MLTICHCMTLIIVLPDLTFYTMICDHNFRSSRPEVFLEISQNSPESTCARVSFLIFLRVFDFEYWAKLDKSGKKSRKNFSEVSEFSTWPAASLISEKSSKYQENIFLSFPSLFDLVMKLLVILFITKDYAFYN